MFETAFLTFEETPDNLGSSTDFFTSGTSAEGHVLYPSPDVTRRF